MRSKSGSLENSPGDDGNDRGGTCRRLSEGLRQRPVLKAKPVGFADGLDVEGERRKNQHRSQGCGLEQPDKGSERPR